MIEPWSLQGADAEFRQDFLLTNALVQGPQGQIRLRACRVGSTTGGTGLSDDGIRSPLACTPMKTHWRLTLYCATRDSASRNTTSRQQFIGSMKEATMDWNRVEGNWKQMKGAVKQQWGKMTDDDLTQIAGSREKLEGIIQERYGIAKDESRKQIDFWYQSQGLG